MTEEKKCWVVVRAASGEMYLANPVHDDGTPMTKKEVLIAMDWIIKFLPAYDYALGLAPGPTGVNKRCIVTPLGMTVTNPPLYLHEPSAVHFVDDMGEVDQQIHYDYIKEVEETIKKAQADGGAKKEVVSPLIHDPRAAAASGALTKEELEAVLRSRG